MSNNTINWPFKSLSISKGCSVLMKEEQWAALFTFIKDQGFIYVFNRFNTDNSNSIRIENIELQVIYTNSAYAYVAEEPPITISDDLSLTVNMIMTIVINSAIFKIELAEKRSAQHDKDVVHALVSWNEKGAKKIIVEMAYRVIKANIKPLAHELNKHMPWPH